MWNSDNDIIFLQETHISSDIYKETEKLWPGTILFSPGKENTGGTAICFRDKNMTANNIITDKNGNYQILDVELNGHKITLTNVYAPSGDQYKIQKDRKSLWTTLQNILTDRSTPDSIHILAGDFNMTEEKQDRTTLNEYQKTCLSQTSLTALKNTLNIEDVYRKQHPSAKQYTYFHHRTMTRTRLDRLYTSKSIGHHITNAALIPTTMSEHYNAPQITITFDKISRGKGVWIFNNNLFQDNEYVKLITETIENQTNSKPLYHDITDWWENTKQTIKQKTVKYAKAKTKQEKKYETYLRKRLRNTLRKEERLRRDNRISQQLRAKIEEIEKKKEQGARIRTKKEWNNDGAISLLNTDYTDIPTKHRLQTDNKNADKQVQTDAAAHYKQTPDSVRP